MQFTVNPYIRRAWYDTLAPNGYIPPRVIFDYEILYIKDGKCSIQVENRVYHPCKGDVFLFRPNRVHRIDVASEAALIQPHVHFDLEKLPDSENVPINMCLYDAIPLERRNMFRPDILGECYPGLPDCIHPNDPSLIEQMMVDVIYAQKKQDTILDTIHVQQLFLQLLHHVLYEMQLSTHSRSDIKDITALRIKSYLDHNNRRSLTLDEIAENCYISKCYMVTVFKSVYGITPHQYHQQQRINESKYLLRFTNSTISEISASMGFDSIHVFTAMFHKYVGMSPTEYRKTE